MQNLEVLLGGARQGLQFYLKLSLKVLPAIAEGPRICQRKNMARAICRGLAQAMLRYSIRSMNFCVSMDIRLVVSPTGKDQFYINCYQIQNPKKLPKKPTE